MSHGRNSVNLPSHAALSLIHTRLIPDSRRTQSSPHSFPGSYLLASLEQHDGIRVWRPPIGIFGIIHLEVFSLDTNDSHFKGRPYYRVRVNVGQLLDITIKLLGETQPMAILDMFSRLIMRNNILVRLFLDEVSHMIRIQVEDITRRKYMLAELLRIGALQFVCNLRPSWQFP